MVVFLLPTQARHILNTSPLYGIFTSGSTGFPKLVLKNRLSLISFIDEYVDSFNFTQNDK